MTKVHTVSHDWQEESGEAKARWYVVHTYSGHEKKVTHTLVQRVETMNLTDKVHEILIPTQNKIKIQKGQKKTIAENAANRPALHLPRRCFKAGRL